MKRYKFVHLMWNKDSNLKFYPTLVEFMNLNFNEKDQLFVTPYENVYDALHKKYDNIELFSSRVKSSCNVVRYCLLEGEWVIMHGMCSSLLFLMPWDYRRIVWRTWGGDVHYTYRKGEIIKNIGKKVLEICKKIVVKRFYAVGIANTVDDIDIRQTFGNINTVKLPYPAKDTELLRKQIKLSSTDGEKINILVGHSGYSNDHHISILESLEHFQDKKIQIHIILSYGDENYIKSVQAYVEKYWPTSVIIHKDFMEYHDYIKFLSTMHIAIFDATTSYALGNISWLIEMKKTLVVNRNGVIRKAFDEDNVPYICSDSLKDISFDELVKKRDFSKMKDGMKKYTDANVVEMWKDCIENLNNVSHSIENAGGGIATHNIHSMPLVCKGAA